LSIAALHKAFSTANKYLNVYSREVQSDDGRKEVKRVVLVVHEEKRGRGKRRLG